MGFIKRNTFSPAFNLEHGFRQSEIILKNRERRDNESIVIAKSKRLWKQMLNW